jgi:putative DNA primase/helicase
VAQETDEGRRWAEARIKALTGGDPVRARFMKQDYFEFIPNFKLIFAGNHKPSLRSVDEAMKRRMHIVPWTVTITAEQRDLDLTEKLKDEYPGILRWMINGCRSWQVNKLAPPAVVVAATDEYLEAEDGLLAWMEERCIFGPEQVTETKDVYQNYVAYCETMKEHPWSHRRLTGNLVSRGKVTSTKNSKGVRVLGGIGMKPVVTESVEAYKSW